MRQVLLVVLIVGAAFAGGALVNGPALQWAQARLLDYMGLKDGGEIASVDLPGGAAPGPQGAAPAPAAPTPPGHPAPAGKAKNNPGPGVAKAAPPASPPPATPAAAPAPASPPPAAVPAPSAPRPSEARQAPAVEANGPPPAPLDPSVGPALLAAISSPSSSPTTTAADPIPLEVAPSSPMDAKPSPAPQTAPPGPDSTHAVAGNLGKVPTGWAALRQRMQDLGVSRYTIEGIPGGRVNFSCLIPLAGKQAVSQRFEAEGDDEFQAAQAAVRRITLWRATRSGAASP